MKHTIGCHPLKNDGINKSRPRFEIGNGVTHLQYGPGAVVATGGIGDPTYYVDFDRLEEKFTSVQQKDLTSLPSRAEYRKSRRQLRQDACYAHAREIKKKQKTK